MNLLTLSLFASGMLWFVLSVIYLNIYITHDKLPDITRTQQIIYPLDSYGFGPKKQLIVFEMLQTNVEINNKFFSKMTWSNIENEQEQIIGMKELDSKKHRKLNYAFEFWAPKKPGSSCTSAETCKIISSEIFDFNEKYEEYVLHGEYNEPTFVRNVARNKLNGNIIPDTLVDVIFKQPDGNHTYEGVYILSPSLSPSVLKNGLNWLSEGNTECVIGQADNSTMIGEFIPDNIQKMPCSEFHLQVKMHYPPCNMDKCFYERLIHFFSVLTLKNTTKVKLNLDSFVNTYLAEMLMREGEFPYTNQYFYVSPDDNVFNAGPIGHYHADFWRVAPDFSWNVFNVYDVRPIYFWVYLSRYQVFIDAVNAARNRMDINHKMVSDVIKKRYDQYIAGEFNRNIERWDVFGKRKHSFIKNILYAAYGHKLNIGSTMEKELKKIQQYIDDRTNDMKATPFKGFKIQNLNLKFWVIVHSIPLIVATFVFIFICSYKYCYLGENQSRNKHQILTSKKTKINF